MDEGQWRTELLQVLILSEAVPRGWRSL